MNSYVLDKHINSSYLSITTVLDTNDYSQTLGISQQIFREDGELTGTGQQSLCAESNLVINQEDNIYALSSEMIIPEDKPHTFTEFSKHIKEGKSLQSSQMIHTKEKPFKSTECEKSFRWKSHLLEHYKIHTGEKPHTCTECGKCFTQMEHLKTHERSHTGEKSFTCTECGKSFKQISHLKTHERIHTGVKPFTCTECGKSFIQMNSLKYHESTHKGEKSFTCTECGKSFIQKSHLKYHERIHTGEEPFACTECGKSFTEKCNLKQHERIHTGEKPYTCTDCGKSFTKKCNLKAHERIHTGEKPFTCTECGKSFTLKSSLKYHERSHTGEKPFTCTECGISFIQLSSLKYHERSHTGEKPFTCTECGISFIQLSSLKYHERIHTGEKPFICTECGKSFTLKSSLKYHEKSHTGEKPFTCTECGKSFTHMSTLKTHERIHKGKNLSHDVIDTGCCIVTWIFDVTVSLEAEPLHTVSIDPSASDVIRPHFRYRVSQPSVRRSSLKQDKKVTFSETEYEYDTSDQETPSHQVSNSLPVKESISVLDIPSTSNITQSKNGVGLSKPNTKLKTKRKCLTEQEISLLQRGLNFAPSCNFNLFSTVLDVNRFVRTLTLKKHFANDDESANEEANDQAVCVQQTPNFNFNDYTAMVDMQELIEENEFTQTARSGPSEKDINLKRFKEKSVFYPIHSRGQHLQVFQQTLETQLIALNNENKKKNTYKDSNLTSQERKAIQTLKDDQSIVIRESDKGGNTVILNRKDYLIEANRQLTNKDVYQPLSSDPTKLYSKILSEIIHKARLDGVFSDMVMEYLLPKNPCVPIFHQLPKLHKDPIHPPGRPIVAGIGSLNERLSDLVDTYLQPIVVDLYGYLKDTTSFIEKIKHVTWYIDDLVLVWDGDQQSVARFLDYVNSNKLNLSFTMTENANTINFLDVTLTSNNDTHSIDIELFRKSTADKHVNSSYLSFTTVLDTNDYSQTLGISQQIFREDGELTGTGLQSLCTESNLVIKQEDNIYALSSEIITPDDKPHTLTEFSKHIKEGKSLQSSQIIQIKEKPFQCTECEKSFRWKSHLLEHYKIHTGEKPHTCTECGKCFTQMNDLNTHERSHTGKKPFTCTECGKSFIQMSSLKYHERIHKEEKPFTCSECGKRFTQKSDLKNHERIHTGEKPFTCTECGKKFTAKSNLKKHERIHTGEKPFTCTECSKCFTRIHHLKTHERIHTGEKSFTCTECGKSFTEKSTLKTHERIHTGEKPFTCRECGKSFTEKSTLKIHVRIHTEEKPFTCTECGKSFTQISSLKSHERIHTGEKPFTCTECGISFIQMSSLKYHESIHTGEKPFTCTECGKSFTLKSTLKNHERSHTGEKPFTCTECGKRFTHMSTLKTHERIHKGRNLSHV
ncbi:uncharacterized protein LOC128661327 [Bombina bombina]|uniref:uncharacterized protein LOC128661327 n=1 Tax=Bombina bombina TaxID=8345 RepID=UPI00235A75A7|nr:uncharacterized protein LOC128661327 [Bombina bombina]